MVEGLTKFVYLVNMVNVILGIDPGLKGGLVFVGEDGRIVAAYKMPVKKIAKRSGGEKSYVDEDALVKIIRSHLDGLLEAWIEDVHAIGGAGKGPGARKDGVVGAFSFGQGKGTLIGVLAALSVPRRFTPPATWKAHMGVSSDKVKTILKAQSLFKKDAALLTKDGPAEAALIALYGFLQRARR